jgi:uncharacterized membrane protein YsdA (DUF1294 family)/cold shock CspA family protein
MASMRFQGKLTDWKDDKGYGFVVQNGGNERVFVHIRDFTARQKRPAVNEIVTYEIGCDPKGRKQAKNVSFVSLTPKHSPESGNLTLTLAAVFLVFVAVATALNKLPVAVPGLYLVASLIAYFAYATDKSAAKQGEWRTPENTLHLLSLIGGWPGALLAQKKLHHKNRKASFQVVFWVTVAVNCAGLALALTPTGTAFLYQVLAMT